jgi:hypothetical protein
MKRYPGVLSRISLSGVLAAALALVACETLQVGSDYDKQASFSNYHTFAMMQRQQHGAHNPLLVQRVEDDIQQQLISKGFQPASDPSTADFTVDFTIGSKERTDITSYPEPYRGWYGGGYWDGAYWGSSVDVRQVHEGTLSIDVFDTKTKRPVWHGWAKKDLSSQDIKSPEEPVRKAVASVLAKFPPGAASAS